MAKKDKKEELPIVKDEGVKVPCEVHQGIFQIVQNNGRFIIGMNNNVISKETFASAEEAKEYIDSKPWELIINATCFVYDMSKKTK